MSEKTFSQFYLVQPEIQHRVGALRSCSDEEDFLLHRRRVEAEEVTDVASFWRRADEEEVE
jgi:hypothetical protein